MSDVTIDDKVWRRLKKLLKRMTVKDPHARVGVLSTKGGRETTEEGITMVDLAAIHEFGLPSRNIPERSFIRRTFRTKEKDVADVTAKLAKQLVAEKISLAKALNALGAWGAAEVKKTVTEDEHIPPPLKKRTIEGRRRKDGVTSDRPLMDTGRLVASVQWDVVIK